MDNHLGLSRLKGTVWLRQGLRGLAIGLENPLEAPFRGGSPGGMGEDTVQEIPGGYSAIGGV